MVALSHCVCVRLCVFVCWFVYMCVCVLMSSGSPLIKNLSVAILQLSESGELDYLRSKWWSSSCVAKNGKSAPLKPASLKGIFLLLALGLGLGLFLALMELAAKSRKIANTQQVSPIILYVGSFFHLSLSLYIYMKIQWI